MGILLCEQNFRDVWIRNKSVPAEIGHILRTHTHTHAAKLVVEMPSWPLRNLHCDVNLFISSATRSVQFKQVFGRYRN